MKELLRGESTISLEAAVLKCPSAELYLYLLQEDELHIILNIITSIVNFKQQGILHVI
jgi:hypothetical protein